jgi:hypothetical protein
MSLMSSSDQAASPATNGKIQLMLCIQRKGAWPGAGQYMISAFPVFANALFTQIFK